MLDLPERDAPHEPQPYAVELQGLADDDAARAQERHTGEMQVTYPPLPSCFDTTPKPDTIESLLAEVEHNQRRAGYLVAWRERTNDLRRDCGTQYDEAIQAYHDRARLARVKLLAMIQEGTR